MTQTTDQNEPTLRDITTDLRHLSDTVTTLSGTVTTLSEKVDRLATEQERFNDRFSSYQQATQWVVQLAFTLIASATITVIVTAVFRR